MGTVVEPIDLNDANFDSLELGNWLFAKSSHLSKLIQIIPRLKSVTARVATCLHKVVEDVLLLQLQSFSPENQQFFFWVHIQFFDTLCLFGLNKRIVEQVVNDLATVLDQLSEVFEGADDVGET